MSGHEPQTVLDTKSDRLTDCQSQSDSDSDWHLVCSIGCLTVGGSHTVMESIIWQKCCKMPKINVELHGGGDYDGGGMIAYPLYRLCSRHWRQPFCINSLTSRHCDSRGSSDAFMTLRRPCCTKLTWSCTFRLRTGRTFHSEVWIHSFLSGMAWNIKSIIRTTWICNKRHLYNFHLGTI
jgi:hypothetical protein